MLKADFHAHTRQTQFEANYSPEQLIDKAAELGYEVFVFTEHYNSNLKDPRYRMNPVENFPRLEKYAKKRGILLLPGVETVADGKEIVVLNIRQDVRKYLDSFDGLRELKKRFSNILILAPHPYFWKSECLKDKMHDIVDILDAVEYCHFYLSFLNLNKKAIKFAKKCHKPMVGTSDAHRFVQLDKTYTMVDARKNIGSVIDAVKKGKVKIVTRPLTLWEFSQVCLFILQTTLHRI